MSEAKLRWIVEQPVRTARGTNSEVAGEYKQECWCLWGRGFVLHAPTLYLGTTMALRCEILKPGGYASVPSCVLSSKLLQPSDKLVYVAILSHLGKNRVIVAED